MVGAKKRTIMQASPGAEAGAEVAVVTGLTDHPVPAPLDEVIAGNLLIKRACSTWKTSMHGNVALDGAGHHSFL